MYKPCILFLMVLAVAVTPSFATFDWGDDDDDRRVPANVDFIVLGVGTSGSVVASQLASAKKSFGRWKYDVLAIEIGKDLTGSELTSNSGNWQGVKASEADWDIFIGPNEPAAKLNDLDKKHITQGRTLGGCSAINSAMFVRGDPDDYNRWGAVNPGWSYNDVLPYFKALETNTNKYATNPVYHGNSGPLRVNGSMYHERLAPFITAAENFGMTYNPDINGQHLITSPKGSIARIDMTTIDRVRQNSWHSFLRPLRDQDNLYIRDQSFVLKINFQGNTARSVTWLDTVTGESQTTRARREIIVSMGAIHTPKLLMLSGVGAKADLEALGIPVVKNLPGVGQNLQDHPLATFGVFSNNLPACLGNGQDPRLDFYFRTSQKPANDMRPDIEVIGSNACNNNFALVYLMSPKSRGYVKLATRDPTSRPIVQPRYFSDPDGIDMKAIIEGIQLTKDLYAQAPVFGYPIYGPANYSDPVGLATYILGTSSVNANTNSGNHIAGTCKMGPASDPTAVVDHRLRVHGIQNLRVVDNSIQPEITSGNTQAPAYMIGMKGAAMILQDNN